MSPQDKEQLQFEAWQSQSSCGRGQSVAAVKQHRFTETNNLCSILVHMGPSPCRI